MKKTPATFGRRRSPENQKKIKVKAIYATSVVADVKRPTAVVVLNMVFV